MTFHFRLLFRIFEFSNQHMKVSQKARKYLKVKFKVTNTNHLVIKAKINGVSGSFILDTGASNSCVGFDVVGQFKLHAIDSQTLAAGAGATNMITQISHNNELNLGRWKNPDFELVIFDLTHVNQALQQHKSKPVHGIIGADILIKSDAIIDYEQNVLFLKKLL